MSTQPNSAGRLGRRARKETIRLLEEIDEVIEAHGGWPIE